MGIARRLAQIFRGRANKALDSGEDPREVLDYSYERQLEMLTKLRRGVADVATSRRRLELQVTQLQQAADKLRDQAAAEVDNGREDLAREALTRRAGVLVELESITAQRDSLLAEENKLSATAARLQARVEAFRTRKETIKANYTAAEAQTRITEAVSGISDEMGDVGLAMRRAEDKTMEMQARASAMDELLASGALEDASLPPGGGGHMDRMLASARANMDAEAELAALKERKAVAGSAAQPAVPGRDAQAALPSSAAPGTGVPEAQAGEESQK